MRAGAEKKIVKEIVADVNKCTGCRSCELACAAFHTVPRYSSFNPARSRIRVYMDEVRDLYVPVRGGDHSQEECKARNRYVMDGKEYPECSFCRASCPARSHFKEPDADLPLKCDMCESIPPLPEPMCVQACKFDALTYVEREEPMVAETVGHPGVETGLESLVEKFGSQRVLEAISKLEKG